MGAVMWTTREGTRIEPHLMGTQHIQRSLYLLMRAARKEMFNEGLDGLAHGFQGEMASYYAENAAMDMMDSSNKPAAVFEYIQERDIVKAFLAELKARSVKFDDTRWCLPEDERALRRVLAYDRAAAVKAKKDAMSTARYHEGY
jgi:hypothetical protein